MDSSNSRLEDVEVKIKDSGNGDAVDNGRRLSRHNSSHARMSTRADSNSRLEDAGVLAISRQEVDAADNDRGISRRNSSHARMSSRVDNLSNAEVTHGEEAVDNKYPSRHNSTTTARTISRDNLSSMAEEEEEEEPNRLSRTLSGKPGMDFQLFEYAAERSSARKKRKAPLVPPLLNPPAFKIYEPEDDEDDDEEEVALEVAEEMADEDEESSLGPDVTYKKDSGYGSQGLLKVGKEDGKSVVGGKTTNSVDGHATAVGSDARDASSESAAAKRAVNLNDYYEYFPLQQQQQQQ
jgi:hypothetical protein